MEKAAIYFTCEEWTFIRDCVLTHQDGGTQTQQEGFLQQITATEIDRHCLAVFGDRWKVADS